MKKTLALLTIMSAFTAAPAFAATGDVIFSGRVDATCTITGITNGTMIPNATNDVLSSKAGGSAVSGGAVVNVTGYNFNASVANPTDFTWADNGTAGPGAAAPVTPSLAAEMTFDTVTYAAGVTAPLTNLLTNVKVDLVATAAPNTSFTNGTYSATVVLTCE